MTFLYNRIKTALEKVVSYNKELNLLERAVALLK